MHGSGIAVDDALRSAFRAFEENDSQLGLTVKIVDDNFVAAGTLSKAGTMEQDFQAIQDSLVAKTPVYVIMRVANQKKFLPVFYVPDNSPVRQKMVYASSTAALKSGLGGEKFAVDWSVSTKDECTAAGYEHDMADHTHLVKSGDERMNAETAYECSTMLGDSQVSAIVGVPIKIADPALEAIKAIRDSKRKTAVLILDPATEILSVESVSDASVAEFAFPEREPRYYVHMMAHEHKGEAKNRIIFVYYCPNKAAPKLKMFYSTVKAHLLKVFASLDINDAYNYECDSPDECTEQTLLDELYPPEVKSKAFKKPPARGRGKAKISKFSAS